MKESNVDKNLVCHPSNHELKCQDSHTLLLLHSCFCNGVPKIAIHMPVMLKCFSHC